MNINELNEYKSIRNLFTYSEYSKRLNFLHKNNSLNNFIKKKENILTLRKHNKKENNEIDFYINKLCKERQLSQEKKLNNNLTTPIKNEKRIFNF
jgi:sucrose-6-phosphate hydrolase SacC (GH32 family)